VAHAAGTAGGGNRDDVQQLEGGEGRGGGGGGGGGGGDQRHGPHGEGPAPWEQWQAEQQQERRDQVRDYEEGAAPQEVQPTDLLLHHAEVAEQLDEDSRHRLAGGSFITSFRCPQCMTPFRVLRPRQPLVLRLADMLQNVMHLITPLVDMAFLGSGVWLAMGAHGMLVQMMATGASYRSILVRKAPGVLALTLPCICISSCWVHMITTSCRDVVVASALKVFHPPPAEDGLAPDQPAEAPVRTAGGFLDFDLGLGLRLDEEAPGQQREGGREGEGEADADEEAFWNDETIIAEEELLLFFQSISLPLIYGLLGRAALSLARPLFTSAPTKPHDLVLSANSVLCGGG
jgi:hypothetical protein